jgi:hypothetical protein
VDIEHILRDFGLILGAGLVSQLIATVKNIPKMVVLVAAGVSMVALAVCVTLLLQATTAGYVARRLGLLDSARSG